MKKRGFDVLRDKPALAGRWSRPVADEAEQSFFDGANAR